MQSQRWGAVAIACALLVALAARLPSAGRRPSAPRLAKAFRMDLSEIEATFDFWQNRRRIEAKASLTFEMRPEQTQPLFHLNPIRGGGEIALDRVELDGVRVGPAEIRYLRPGQYAERGYEVRREISDGEEHELEVRWSMRKPDPPHDEGWFFPAFDDTEGRRTRRDALAHGLLARGARAACPSRPGPRRRAVSRSGVGSGHPRPSAERVQAWTVETPTTVSSSNVFFAAVPAREFRAERLEVSGVDVEILSNQGERRTKKAMRKLRFYIPRLVGLLGPSRCPSSRSSSRGGGAGWSTTAPCVPASARSGTSWGTCTSRRQARARRSSPGPDAWHRTNT